MATRYWNAFGTVHPRDFDRLAIDVEVNPGIERFGAYTGGAFARQGEDWLLLHDGRIGGGRSRVGPGLFWSHYAGDQVVADAKAHAIVCNLSQGPVSSLANFIRTVGSLKPPAKRRGIKMKEPDPGYSRNDSEAFVWTVYWDGAANEIWAKSYPLATSLQDALSALWKVQAVMPLQTKLDLHAWIEFGDARRMDKPSLIENGYGSKEDFVLHHEEWPAP